MLTCWSKEIARTNSYIEALCDKIEVFFFMAASSYGALLIIVFVTQHNLFIFTYAYLLK